MAVGRTAFREGADLLPVEPTLVVAYLQDGRPTARHDRPPLQLEALAGDAPGNADQLVVDHLGVQGCRRAANRERAQRPDAGRSAVGRLIGFGLNDSGADPARPLLVDHRRDVAGGATQGPGAAPGGPA